MKIAFIGQKGIPATYGGVERYVEELSTRLAARGHGVWVYCRPYYTVLPDKMYHGVYLVKVPTIPSKHLDTIVHTFLSTVHMMFRDYDIIYVHSIGPSLLIPLMRLMKPRSKVISVFQSRDDEHAKWGGFARAILRFGAWMACHTPHATLSSSKDITEYAKNVLHADTIQMYNGVPRARDAGSDIIAKKFGLTKSEYFLVASRFVEHKNIHTIIRAFKNLKTDKKLVLAGDSVYTDAYTKQLMDEAAGDERIIFTGFQQGEVLWQLFQNAYAFVTASRAEGLPLSVLEAMSYGTAVIASDIPAHHEALSNFGFYFPAGDDQKLQVLLERLLSHPEEIFAAGGGLKHRALTIFDWDAITAQIEEILMGLLSELPRHATEKVRN